MRERPQWRKASDGYGSDTGPTPLPKAVGRGSRNQTRAVRLSRRRVEQPLFSNLDSERRRFFEGFFDRISCGADFVVYPECCLSRC